MYERECEVTYHPQMTKVKVKVCPDQEEKVMNDDGEEDEDKNSVVIDVRPQTRTLKETK